jgi:hypothetical protein
MSEVYRKFGRAVRYENGTTIRVDEAGEAIEDAQTFACRPIARSVQLPEIDGTAIEKTVSQIQSIVRAPLAIERLIVSEGVAEHEFEGRRWRDATRRIHLAMTFRQLRALIDLGDFVLDDVRLIATALSRAEDRIHTESQMRLAPNVSAALLPALINIAPPNIQLMQTAGGVDGKGLPIGKSTGRWPNWYRPSYRGRPIRAPFSLRATCDVKDIDEDLPRAIALLAPVERLTLHVLCVHRDAVFPATVRIARIDAISDATRWYPYGAGSFGAELML